MMDCNDDWLQDSHTMLRELGWTRSIHIVDAKEVPIDRADWWWAYTSVSLSAQLGGAADGFAMVVRSDCIHSPSAMKGVVLHELAHQLQKEPLIAQADSDAVIRRMIGLETRAKLKMGETLLGPDLVSRPWQSHDGSFARVLAHLWFRAVSFGWNIDENRAYPGSYYLQPSLRQFYNALDGEPRRLRDLPMTEIAALPPSPEFLRFTDSAIQSANDHFQERQVAG